MKKKKLKKQLSKTEKKLARAKAELKELRSENHTEPNVPAEVKVMAAQ
jgi:hypothetical protein